MRFSSDRLAATAALASIVCLVLSPVAAKDISEAHHAPHNERSLQEATVDVPQALWNNGHHCTSSCKHNNNQSSYVDLVCDGVVIDELTCCNTFDPAVAGFDALNNGGSPSYRYVEMQSPCSPNLPDGCEPALEAESLADDQDDSGAYAETYDVNAESANAVMPANLPPSAISLWKKKHHHCSRCHKNHDGPCNQGGGGGGSQHPYQDLCVAVGEFCGNELFGCNFDKNTLYRCDQIGKPPVSILGAFDTQNRCISGPVTTTTGVVNPTPTGS
ncbi:hypothetical protein DFQ27_004090, partial [Actinomortierella ambigua]